ncbi:glycosyltransferase involved in cell wall biosynthesis [Flavobacterium nitrogenifigens]|uniref:Glycosyltransferase involved in cell wall biosynthesis n=2 Tax=Flavobacterium TaxID=237 RepID=A0A7W7IZU9_9FLAO|nr:MULTISPECIES: glycosyltransferase family 4 protein [Flavobacterium]MBB4803639.1 glycosyltransferase involved in cell wall biosynthesis [Flavobacterium nitrogenifigens]MBB6388556.1 glycosyltransferase involved in cell wall biosynthesis [Flavobacterium notoginsengisoli]
MNIAFLTPEYSHPKVAHAAGIGTSIKNLAIALQKEGNDITVFVYGQSTQEIIDDNGVKIHLIKNRKHSFFGWYLHRKHIEKYCNSVINKEKIEILEAPDWTGITAFMKFRIPLVIRFHGSDTYFCHLEKRKQRKKNFWFEKLALQDAKAFIAPTDFAGKLTNTLFKNQKIETKVIPNGIDLTLFKNEFPEQYIENTILYIGTLIRKKGVLELPSIFNQVRKSIPNAKLILIGGDSFDIQTGSDSTWKIMQNSFEPEDLENVSYLGQIAYKEVQQHIKEANVCVFPSFAETLGMVTIEAMAMQKAIVNTNIGWAQELINDQESGFLVHPTNHMDYANRIIELLQNKKLALEIGKKARLRVEDKFDIKKIAKENIMFYSKIINSNSIR